ncbi:MAG: aldo/keto reductase [bacterium]|nr:aldo/keto reductase [bacterium]
MDYVNLGKHGVKVSRLCLGTMMFGGPTEETESIRMIHRAMDEGINFIDTANVYNAGESERVLGKAIKDRRDRVVLVTKVINPMGEGPNAGGASRYHILNEVENSLSRLGTDHIDLYILHKPDYSTPLEESLEALNDLVRQGKVRYIGMSNYYAWQVCETLWISDKKNLASVACVQPLYNIVNRDAEVELFPLCKEHGIGAMVYSPLARGVLAGKYLPGKPLPEGSRGARGDRRMLQTELREESFEVAQKLKPLADAHGKTLTQFSLNWVLGNPIVTSALVGPRTMEHLEDNLGCMGWQMENQALEEIDRLVPPGEHTGFGFNDPAYPVMGRPQS